MNLYLEKIKNISFCNKYTNWYIDIIIKAQTRANTEEDAKTTIGYFERHHIIPKSFAMGGEKDPQNIVFLSGKEHFIVHILLPKMIIENTLKQKMSWAIVSMLGQNNKGDNKFVSSVTYETAKKIFNKNNINRPDYAKPLKTYTVKNPNGEIIEIKNLPKFCEENNLLPYMIRKISHGDANSHRGYSAINFKEKVRMFKDSSGHIYKMSLSDLKVFCKDNKLNYQTMRRLTLNVVKNHKNFSCIENSEIKTTAKTHKFLDPNGILITIENLPDFCRENNFNYSTFRSVSNGSKRKTKEGYIKYIQEDVN